MKHIFTSLSISLHKDKKPELLNPLVISDVLTTFEFVNIPGVSYSSTKCMFIIIVIRALCF